MLFLTRIRFRPFFPLAVALAIVCIAQTALAQDAPLPAGKEVIERYIEVTGGRDAYKNVKTRVSHSTLEAPAMGLKGKLIIYQSVPDKGYIETDIAGVGRIEQGTDGTVVWERSAFAGLRLLEGQERESLMRSFNIQTELEPDKYYTDIQTVAVEEVDGKPAYKLELTLPSGAKETRFYDKESGLLLKSRATTQSQMGEVEVVSRPADYKEMAGITIPTKITQEMMGQTITLSVDKVEHNVDIPAEKFALPEDVKKLAEKQAASQGESKKGE